MGQDVEFCKLTMLTTQGYVVVDIRRLVGAGAMQVVVRWGELGESLGWDGTL